MKNVQYYGFVYEGKCAPYNVKKETQVFSDPYKALKYANDMWNSNPEYQVARLLLVLKLESTEDSNVSFNTAFFQFTNSKACESFIIKQKEIIWSIDDNQVWNGNARMMK